MGPRPAVTAEVQFGAGNEKDVVNPGAAANAEGQPRLWDIPPAAALLHRNDFFWLKGGLM